MPEPPLRAACLTPPAAGGIAVIQIIGPDAAGCMTPLLRCNEPMDWERADAERLYLCRIVDGEQILDDTVVAVRQTANRETVVDLNLHGGVRLVQRVLMLLQRAGVQIVAPADLLGQTGSLHTAFEAECLHALMQAQTRAVAGWLLRMKSELPDRVQTVAKDLAAGKTDTALAWLIPACERAASIEHLLHGARVVLTGTPNAGKSTLANSLAERDAAIVHPTPGTTRDWTEHPGAIDGVPITYVDTAGLRETTDPVEREAIERARRQAAQAHVAIHVVDGAAPPDDENWPPCHLVAWNKCDLRGVSARLAVGRRSVRSGETPSPPPAVVPVSALTGWGIEDLRRAILQAIGLTGWQRWSTTPFTPRQHESCRQALALLTDPAPQPASAVEWLQSVISFREAGSNLVPRI